MSSDYYAILGVAPTAESVVIGAAYRALMRHYHPDSNPDPKAQARAREITAAYAVLGDPAKRAEYDAGRADDLWTEPEPAVRRPPPMRGLGIGASLLAAGLIAGAIWLRPRNEPLASRPTPAASSPQPAAEPPVVLEPEEHRLAALGGTVADPSVRPPPVSDGAPERPRTALPAAATVSAPLPRHAIIEPTSATPLPTAADAPQRSPPQAGRIATLDRMSSSFFAQSMTHADPGKQQLLQAARDRSEAQRKACRSDACVADAYVRQIRETSAIMEARTESPR